MIEYGTLLTAQGRGSYREPSQAANLAAATLGNTQNWANLAAATSASSSQERLGWIEGSSSVAAQGLRGYGDLASSMVNAYGGIGQQGLRAKGDERVAELAIKQEMARRPGLGRTLATAGVGLAGALLL